MSLLGPAEPDTAVKVGVLPYAASDAVDTIIGEAVARLRARGLTVGGLLQRSGERLANGRHAMWVDDIATGQSIRLDLPRGPGARACILDPDALAQAACLLRRTTETRPDVIVVNRFGHAEAEGGGMRAEIADAMFSGAAVLLAVRPGYLSDLKAFIGGPPTLLVASAVAVADWAAGAVAIDQPAAAG